MSAWIQVICPRCNRTHSDTVPPCGPKVDTSSVEFLKDQMRTADHTVSHLLGQIREQNDKIAELESSAEMYNNLLKRMRNERDELETKNIKLKEENGFLKQIALLAAEKISVSDPKKDADN